MNKSPMDVSNNLTKSEMLAEEFINTVSSARQQLESGRAEECLSMLLKMEESMQIILAIGELLDIDQAVH